MKSSKRYFTVGWFLSGIKSATLNVKYLFNGIKFKLEMKILDLLRWMYVTFFCSYLPAYCKKSIEIPIGMLGPQFLLSGAVNVNGTHFIAAIFMAIREINNKTDGVADNLLKDYTLKLAAKFPRQNFLEAITAGQYLAEHAFNNTGVIGVVGSSATSSSIATAQVFANTKRHIPQVGYGANDSSLGHKDLYPYYLRTISTDAHDGKILASFMKNYFGWSAVTVFSSGDTYGNDAFLEFQAEAEIQGISVQSHFSFLSGITDFSTVIQSAIDKGGILKVFVLLMKSVDAGRLIEQGYGLGLFQKGCQILGTEYVMMPATWQAMSPKADVAKVMNGVIGVSSYASRNSSEYLDFVSRWRKQPNTEWKTSSGATKCLSTRDDDNGEWLYQGYPSGDPSTSKLTCCGVDFSSFAEDGLDIEDVALFAYDAVYSLARGLDLLGFDGNMSANHGAQLYDLLVSNVSFDGVTGRVEFGSGILGTEAYGRGDRVSGLVFNVLTFNPDLYHANVNAGAGALIVVGTWDSDTSTFTPCSAPANVQCAEWHFNTIDNSIPLDVAPVLEVQMDPATKAGLQTGAALSVLLTLFFWAVVYFCEDHPLIKLAQPKMMYIVLLGALCAGIRVFVASMNITIVTCIMGKWLGHVSFALVFGALLIKTWRLGKVVNSGMRRVKITVTDIQRMFAIGFFIFCLIILLDTLVGQPQRTYDSYFDGRHDVHLVKCKNKIPSTTTVLFVIEGCLMGVGAKLCWSTKDVPSAVNDSKYIAISMYLLLFVCAVTFPVVFLSIAPTPANLITIMSSGFAISVAGTLAFMFGPRTVHIFDFAETEDNSTGYILHDNNNNDHEHQNLVASAGSGGHSNPGSRSAVKAFKLVRTRIRDGKLVNSSGGKSSSNHSKVASTLVTPPFSKAMDTSDDRMKKGEIEKPAYVHVATYNEKQRILGSKGATGSSSLGTDPTFPRMPNHEDSIRGVLGMEVQGARVSPHLALESVGSVRSVES